MAKQKGNRSCWVIFCVIFSLLVLALGCSQPKELSPAPGCRKSFGMGGCFGKTAILDVTVEPAIDCLLIEGDNCNGGVLDVHNACSEDLIFANVSVPAGDYTTFDFVKEVDGSFSLMIISSNFSEFIPQSDTALTFTGYLGDQEITISFTKTAPLCE